jgi:hypothetical protein
MHAACATEINSAVPIFGPWDYELREDGGSRCTDMVDRAALLPNSRIMFLPTLFWVSKYPEGAFDRKMVRRPPAPSSITEMNGMGLVLLDVNNGMRGPCQAVIEWILMSAMSSSCSLGHRPTGSPLALSRPLPVMSGWTPWPSIHARMHASIHAACQCLGGRPASICLSCQLVVPSDASSACLFRPSVQGG